MSVPHRTGRRAALALPRLILLALVGLGLAPSAARAQNQGFSLIRYSPTSAGEWSFMVDHPWYTRSKFFAAAGLTLDYGHNPLVFGTRSPSGDFTQRSSVIEHQLVGHLDLAGSFLDRVTISASLPVVLLERGTAVQGFGPIDGAAVGDLRLGAMVRVFGQPLADAFSLHLGAQLWVPIGAGSDHAGDSGVRGLIPKLALGGLSHHVLWSFTGAYVYRPTATLGALPPGPGNTIGQELQFGAALGYMDLERRFSVGPEALLSTVVSDGHAFDKDFTSLELLVGGQYNIIRQIQVGLAAGLGLLREPGTPDARVIFRLAYSPMRTPEPTPPPPPDRDRDGIVDARDACPDEPGPASSDPRRHGCPPPPDRDRDGVTDAEDLCPDEPVGQIPDPARRGCPALDSDGDGVFDFEDACPVEASGPNPDPAHKGCPDKDSDSDGVFDAHDQCRDVPAGRRPDPVRAGCPLPDRDADQIPDVEDACPDEPGAPHPDPKKNGCPGKVELREGKLVIMEPVYFATDKDVILAKSFPVLQAVADALVATPTIKRVSIEGHTDDRGKPARNLDLSERRAKSVRRFLVEHGVAEGRLEAKGFGQEKPLQSNKTEAGRAANRRVEFRIVEQTAGEQP